MPNVQTKAFVNENEDLQKDKSQKDNSSLNGKLRDKQSTADRYGTGDIIQLQADKIYTGHENSRESGYQDFYRLKRKYSPENRLNGKLFEDPAFPAEESSIERVKMKRFAKNVRGDVKWLRPKEINSLAKFFVDGYSRFDVKQGSLGDCWFVAAAASLAMHPKLFTQVVPEDNGSFGEDHAGIFHFRFWQSGRWVDVVIDDRLPTHNDGKLIFAKSTSTNEFWIALLEKAYAKLHGSYGALNGGYMSTAFNDLTGGVTETYHLDVASYDEYANRKYDDPYYSQLKVFTTLLKAQEQNLLMGIYSLKKIKGTNLVGRHAYSITGVYNHGENRLVRLRNPWGYAEWRGLFSDKRSFWDERRAKELREKLNLVIDADGEFWMPFKRAVTFFSHIEICYLNATQSYSTKSSPYSSEPWTIREIPLKRVEPVHVERARDGDEEVFLHHPQHRMTLRPLVEQGDGKHRLIVALTSNAEKRTDSTDLAAGFQIYQLPASPDIKESEGLGMDFLCTRNPIFQSNVEPFNRNHGVQCFVELQAGSYCIIPYTTRPAEGTKFSVELWSRVTPNKDALPVKE